jgi:hypothetical protein
MIREVREDIRDLKRVWEAFPSVRTLAQIRNAGFGRRGFVALRSAGLHLF